MTNGIRFTGYSILLGLTTIVAGCAWFPGSCGSCGPCGESACQPVCCQSQPCGRCRSCCGGGRLHAWKQNFFGYFHRSSNAIPETLPLGSTVRAHDQVMQTNGEAVDFVIYRLDFVGQTSELTSDGKDHVLEIAARMRSAPFPVVIEREPNNSDPELDALRRNLVATILTDLGNPDAQQRTVVGLPYGPGFWGMPAQFMYYQYVFGFGGGNGNGFGNGNAGGFGGGGGGGGFF